MEPRGPGGITRAGMAASVSSPLDFYFAGSAMRTPFRIGCARCQAVI